MPAVVRTISKPESTGENVTKVATNWLFFWLVAGIMVAKDVIDLLLTALEMATTATVVGMPIAVFCAIVGGIMTLTVGIIAMLYHFYTRKALVTKFIITSICGLIGMIPVISVLPDASIAFFASFFVGNAVRIAGKIAGGVVSTPSGAVLG